MTGIIAKTAARGGGAFSVAANNVTKSSAGFSSTGVVTTTQLPNPVVSGGVAPFSYLWEYVSGSTEIAVDASGAPNTTWTGTVSDAGPEVAVWQLTVTDAGLNEATVEITVTLIWLNLGG